MLKQQGYIEYSINDRTKDAFFDGHRYQYLWVEVFNKIVIYDMLDGYQYPNEMCWYLHRCDYYFKRSFSSFNNNIFEGDDKKKMYPLGFNYALSYPGSIMNEPLSKKALKLIAFRKPYAYFEPKRFENSEIRPNDKPIICFTARLYEKEDDLNEMRISLVRALRNEFKGHFWGGIQSTDYAKRVARDLVLDSYYTRRDKYIKRVKKSDIGIATDGLHGSIDWKTGEYVAAGLAIVSQRFNYEIPGRFREGDNYLVFNSVDECINCVYSLIENPKRLYCMRKQNKEYYENYLRPDVLVRNTLDIVMRDIDD